MTQLLARPGGVSAQSAGLIRTRPMRDPDFGSPDVMTRRGWWLVVLNVLIPGSAQVLAGNRRLGRFGLAATLTMWTLVVLGTLGALLWHEALLWLTVGGGWVSWLVLSLIQLLCIAYVVLWVVLTFDTLRLVRLVRTKNYAKLAIPLVAVLVLSLCGSGAAYAANVVGSSRSAISTLFGSGGPSLPPSDGYYNVLLLGADSGMGRDSMRYDSISVVSVNAETGKTTIFGIPRDMPHVPFAPGPMHDLYPDGLQAHEDSECGWGSGINQLTNAAEYCHTGPSLYPDAKNHGSRPAVEATKDAAEGVLGIKIPYYVFLDMNDFAKLIDALGGVDINVKERLPEGNVPEWGNSDNAEEWATGWIEAGQQHMNGDTAQWYARSRYTTSDFDRMRRQRELQDALMKQFTPQNVAAHFSEIAAAGTSAVDTDLPQDKLPEFFDLMMKAKKQKLTTIDLTPANGVDELEPDWNQIHGIVKAALHPEPSPAPTS